MVWDSFPSGLIKKSQLSLAEMFKNMALEN